MFWLSNLAFPLFFYEEASSFLYDIFAELQISTIFVCVLVYITNPTRRESTSLLLLCFYSFFIGTLDFIFKDLSQEFYLAESVSFSFLAFWIMMRPEYKTPRGVDPNNILLAFYMGDKGSLIMRFFEMFGLPVKSMCIVAGEKCLKLSSCKETFQFSNSGLYFQQAKEYYLHDTGVPITKEFLTKMAKYGTVSARKNGLRIRCIEAVSDLLGDIDERYRPKSIFDNNPSMYFKKVTRL